jgi:hypothetical protein
MQIQQFGFVCSLHGLQFLVSMCVVWFGGAQQQQQQHWVRAC